MHGLRALLNGERLEIDGEFAQFDLDPPRIATVNPGCPPMYFGGFSEAAKQCAAEAADVFLTWPTRSPRWVKPSPTCAAAPMRSGATDLRPASHMIVRETEAEGEPPPTDSCRSSTSTPASRSGTSRSTPSRPACHVRTNSATALTTTATPRPISGPALVGPVPVPGAAIVGDPDQVVAKLKAYQEVGVEAFILSGYTHIAECDLVAEHVLPNIEHSALRPRWS